MNKKQPEELVPRGCRRTTQFAGFRMDSTNRPLLRPGIYLIRHIATRKCYVGMSANVASRLRDHARCAGACHRLSATLRSYGKAAFKVVPLYYAIGDVNALPRVEAVLMAQYRSLAPRGYNYNLPLSSDTEYAPAPMAEGSVARRWTRLTLFSWETLDHRGLTLPWARMQQLQRQRN